MTALVRFPVEGGGTVLVEELTPAVSGPVRVGRAADLVKDASVTLQAALAPVRDVARTVLAELRETGPDELTVEFGVCLTAEAGAVIARTEAGTHLVVTLTWKRSDTPAVMP